MGDDPVPAGKMVGSKLDRSYGKKNRNIHQKLLKGFKLMLALWSLWSLVVC